MEISDDNTITRNVPALAYVKNKRHNLYTLQRHVQSAFLPHKAFKSHRSIFRQYSLRLFNSPT